MCGIAVIYDLLKNDISDLYDNNKYCRLMTEKLKNRGPDDLTIYNNDFLFLGHTRLSIIDINNGRQPLFNEDKTICTILNGEIYNYKSLKNDLIKKGHIFYTDSDTEVIVHLYEEYGENLFNKIDGMFGIILYDKKKKTLLVGRDRIGEKPILYFHNEKYFIAASELKAIVSHPEVKNSLNISHEALCLYFNSLYIPAPYSIYSNILKLQPSHYIKINDKEIKIIKYWNPEIEINWKLKEEDIKQKLINIVENSVVSRMHADVPLGVFLSGGLDSSVTTSFMALNSKSKVNTYSVGFNDDFDERKDAKQVADKYKTNHNEILINEDIENSFKSIMGYFDEPFADPSLIPTYLISKYARNHVKVVLSGDGADELFGGYSTYIWQKYSIHNRIINGLFRRINQFTCKKFDFDITQYTYQKNDNSSYANKWINSRSYYNNNEIPFLLNNRKSFSVYDFYNKNKWFNLKNHDSLSSAFEYDLNYYLPDDLLKKVDMASMFCGIEVRSPYLNHKLIEFAMTIPPYLKLKNDITKYLFRYSFDSYLPKKIINKKKMGFGPPITFWMRNQLKTIILDLLSSNSKVEQYIDRKVINENIHNVIYTNGDLPFGIPSKLWTIFVFEWWLREFS